MNSAAVLVLLVIGVLETSANQDDYVEWVPYTGDIPANAVPGGVDAKNNTVYIGRVYLNTNSQNFNWSWEHDAQGYVSGTITPGVVALEVVLFQKVHNVTEGIEILTTLNHPKLEWKFVRYYEFSKLFDTEEYHPVRIGWEFEGTEFNSTTYLGKVHYNDKDNIGKIFNAAQYWADSNYLYFAAGNDVLKASTFWSLVYYY